VTYWRRKQHQSTKLSAFVSDRPKIILGLSDTKGVKQAMGQGGQMPLPPEFDAMGRD